MARHYRSYVVDHLRDLRDSGNDRKLYPEYWVGCAKVRGRLDTLKQLGTIQWSVVRMSGNGDAIVDIEVGLRDGAVATCEG